MAWSVRTVVVALLACLAAQVWGQPAALTNEDLVRASRAGLRDEFIVSLIQQQPSGLQTAVRQLAELKAAGVSETVVLAAIRKSPPAEPLTATGLVLLAKAGFSENFLLEILKLQPVRIPANDDRISELRSAGIGERVLAQIFPESLGNKPSGSEPKQGGSPPPDVVIQTPPPGIVVPPPPPLPRSNLPPSGDPRSQNGSPSGGPGSGYIGAGPGGGSRLATTVNEWKALAEKGNPEAQYHLGIRYETGQEVLQNYAEALRWLRKAAEQGYGPAQFRLWQAYTEGKLVPRDSAEAVRWLRKAAEHGHGPAQLVLGQLYAEGKLVPKDHAEAVQWLRKAAEQGQPLWRIYLAVMSLNGKASPKELESVHELLFEDGHNVSPAEMAAVARIIAESFHYGYDTAPDLPQALNWYRKAAEQGDATTQVRLGLMYAEGRGVTRDEQEAVRWFRRAAEQGDASAQSLLSFMYWQGRGVPTDLVEAHAWANLAIQKLGREAIHFRENLAKQMTSEQLREAQERAVALLRQYPESPNIVQSRIGLSTPTDVHRVGDGVSEPALIRKVEPEYSEAARQAKWSGTVIVSFEINEQGIPEHPRVLRSTGFGLEEKAIEAIMQWRFRPAMRDGKPVSVTTQVEISFRLL